ncbi:nucleotidyl transferase AbiEii/AbiGii toxin family protein [Rhodococcus zopfii]|uniref:nucleotidyl transferase AbiEii/AbiGii toxin family protein n=1 Tax=Rhodococcus zopfii TaxID=43772 RepID=UPI0009334072|nr:nucleotidyl transferase AbiEii/AbiGii toxin family protein [Rhodococcus zopfii]
MTQRYRSPGAFQMALNARIKSVAMTTGTPAAQVRRQFLAQRFLARVFADPAAPWVLTGGTGLLVRLAGARHSEDLDLLHTSSGTDAAAAIADLRATITATEDLDPFRFTISVPTTLHGLTGGATVRVNAHLGTTAAGNFPVDLVVGRSTVGRIERIAPAPVLDLDGITPTPAIALYPIANQVADKISAMFYRYGPRRSPSTRFHDLVDLLFIVTRCTIPAADTHTALASEFRRRQMPAVAAISVPGDRWHDGYRRTARLAGLAAECADLDTALAIVGTCLNPLLTGTRTTGTWSPETATWHDD